MEDVLSVSYVARLLMLATWVKQPLVSHVQHKKHADKEEVTKEMSKNLYLFHLAFTTNATSTTEAAQQTQISIQAK